MKIIHCGDIHLDSALTTSLTVKQAALRRDEILISFVNMVRYAKDTGVRIIIIAGDLFDTAQISKKTRQVFADCVAQNPQIDFLYLCGNHDEKVVMGELKKMDNLKMFSGMGCSYRYGNIVFTGLTDDRYICNLSLKKDDVNILIMHTDTSVIKQLRGKNVDYLALGHIHKVSRGVIDERGVYGYCGCLEPRGFDECTKHGFVELNVSDGEVRTEYVEFGKRSAHIVEAELKSDMDTAGAVSFIEDKLAGISHDDMVKVVVSGKMSVEAYVDFEYLTNYFEGRYFAFRLENKTTPEADIEKYMKENSLRGHFVRTVMASDDTMQMKCEIIKCGLDSLNGEAVR